MFKIKMKTSYILTEVTSQTTLNIPANRIDLSKWIFEMSDIDYQDCAEGHLGAGISLSPTGKKTSINAEKVGGKNNLGYKNHSFI
ncbi:MAG: hypothetical protein ABIH18_03800 [Candidatus Omnitrophota bacterium]